MGSRLEKVNLCNNAGLRGGEVELAVNRTDYSISQIQMHVAVSDTTTCALATFGAVRLTYRCIFFIMSTT